MDNRHWSDEQLIAGLYGVGPDGGHVEHCPECRGRWDLLRARRGRMLSSVPRVSEEFLAAQRRLIRARLERESPVWRQILVPGLLAALMALTASLMLWTEPAPPPPVEFSESRSFEEIFTVAQELEPAPLEPIRALFEVQP